MCVPPHIGTMCGGLLYPLPFPECATQRCKPTAAPERISTSTDLYYVRNVRLVCAMLLRIERETAQRHELLRTMRSEAVLQCLVTFAAEILRSALGSARRAHSRSRATNKRNRMSPPYKAGGKKGRPSSTSLERTYLRQPDERLCRSELQRT